MTGRPYADAVLAYAQAGWAGILPVPPATKTPPPAGFTGADGADPDPLQLVTWAGSHADSSVALRMPDGVIGIDVDQYEKGGVQKHGADTLAAAVERWGDLPATWRSTARKLTDATHPPLPLREGGGLDLSGIYFFRVPPGRYATRLPGGDVEIIQRHHRYAVVWPSFHHDASAEYRWYTPDGAALTTDVPMPDLLPELPAAWVDGLREGATEAGPAAAGVIEGALMRELLLADDRPGCPDMVAAVQTALDDLLRADAGSRHDTATGRVHQIVQLGAEGHPGAGTALQLVGSVWDQLTAGEARAEEFERMLLTSARKAVTVVGPEPVKRDPCTLTGGLEAALPLNPSLPAVGGPAPGDDRPDGHDALEPIQRPEELHPIEVLGATPFTPRAHLDQLLADAVLERMAPMLRYGYDIGGWLKRDRTAWDMRGELAEWAITQVADTMPHGDPDAEKGTDARDQADRRKRLMTSAGAAGVAKMMRARVAGGSHPCALRVADLDAEPWLLWAGGLPWDLTASAERPALAQLDPATPHLRSAGMAPDVLVTPLWDTFTTAVWPDPGLRAWALRVLAISVTGYADKALPILIGPQNAGKTQVIALLMSVLGSYAHAADPRLLNGLDNAHASIIYALKGRRLSFIDEGPREGRLGQERLKQLTGGGDLTGNQMNRNPITFTPTHTLVLTTNDEPLLTDPAVRGRTRLIPCDGEPGAVREARAAIGHTSGRAWRREAPGVLAMMMAEAAAWLADPDSALTSAAPEAYRQLAEHIAEQQDPVRTWAEEEAEPHPDGERSRALYEAFVGWSKNGNAHPGRIPSETAWGKRLTELGFPMDKRRDGNYRPLRLRLRGGGYGGYFPTAPQNASSVVSESVEGCGGLVEGSNPNPPHAVPPAIAGLEASETILVEGVEGLSDISTRVRAPAPARTRAHTHAHTQGDPPINPPHPPQPSTAPVFAGPASAPTLHQPSTNPPRVAFSAQLSEKLRAAADAAKRAELAAPSPAKRVVRADPAEKAAAKAAQKAAVRQAKIDAAAGELVTLPAVVTRDGAVTETSAAAVPELAAGLEWLDALTVDVEHTGYPIGHADYALRTVQLGNEWACIYLDADDPEQLAAAGRLLGQARILHAHSATADLVPLAVAGVIDIDHAWDRMHDTVIPAKLADPRSTGSDPGLKKLAPAVLGDGATVPAAEEARAALFKAGDWLTETESTTPLEKSGWAQVDSRCATMVRYGASDVLDTAALAKRLPPLPPAILERERAAQRLTARIAHQGVRLDPEHVREVRERNQEAAAAAAVRVRTFGIDNPGSTQQVAARLADLGAPLPRTKTGRLSVAKGVIEAFRNDEGPVGDCVRAVLDYRKPSTALSLLLNPYHELVTRGDGRARPTVYTLGADTGRMSCVRPNLQQVSRQGGIRACVTADPGELIITADFAGVEVRVAAALSGDPNLQRMVAEGVDLHGLIAREVYGPGATKEDRYNTKRGVFGRLYGSGISGIARTLAISQAKAAATVDVLDSFTPQLARYTAELKQAVQRGMRTFETYSGRIIHLDPKLPHKALNYLVQGTARELLIDTLVRWQDTPWGRCRLMPVHDELLVFVPEADAKAATAALVACMEATLFGVAIKAEASAPAFAWQDAS